MEYVVFYAINPANAARLREVYPRHREYLDAFAQDGSLLSIGPFADSVADGSMAIFSDRDSAERFVAGDPFVTEEIAIPGDVKEWNALSFR